MRLSKQYNTNVIHTRQRKMSCLGLDSNLLPSRQMLYMKITVHQKVYTDLSRGLDSVSEVYREDQECY